MLKAVQGLTGSRREAKLAALAKKEGDLNFYSSLFSDAVEGVAKDFGDTYDVDPTVFRGTSEVVAQRVSEERKAGFKGADVLETNAPELATIKAQGGLIPYRSPEASSLLPGSIQDGWTADRFNKFVVSWNTRLVHPGRQPRSWEDLADPKWKGKLALEASDADWYKGLHDYWVQQDGKSEAQANRLFEAIARNSRIVTGHSLMGELLGAGEYSVAVSNYNHLIQDSIDKGAPVAKQPVVEPVLSRPAGISIVRGAPHPAAALLFYDWILSPDGQKSLTKYNLDPARKGISGTLKAREFLIDIRDFIAHQQEWTDRYDKLTSLGSAIKGGG